MEFLHLSEEFIYFSVFFLFCIIASLPLFVHVDGGQSRGIKKTSWFLIICMFAITICLFLSEISRQMQVHHVSTCTVPIHGDFTFGDRCPTPYDTVFENILTIFDPFAIGILSAVSLFALFILSVIGYVFTLLDRKRRGLKIIGAFWSVTFLTSIVLILTYVGFLHGTEIWDAVSKKFPSAPATQEVLMTLPSATVETTLVSSIDGATISGTAAGVSSVMVLLADNFGEVFWHSDPPVPVVHGRWVVHVSIPNSSSIFPPGTYKVIVDDAISNPHDLKPALTESSLRVGN